MAWLGFLVVLDPIESELVPHEITRIARGGAAYYGHEFDRAGAEELASGDHPAC